MTKIALTGAPCAHKTTLWAQLWADLKHSPEYYDVIGLTESARECPFELNQYSFRANLWMLQRQIALEEAVKEESAIICDRSVLDPAMFLKAYTLEYNAERQKEINFILDVAMSWMKLRPYDLIINLRPQPLQLDIKRKTTPQIQQHIAKTINHCLSMYVPDRVVELDSQNYAEILAMVKRCIDMGRPKLVL